MRRILACVAEQGSSSPSRVKTGRASIKIMTSRDLLTEALELPPAERARVRHLILSLDQDQAADPAAAGRAWAAELEGRAEHALRGESSARDLADACAELEAKRPSKA